MNYWELRIKPRLAAVVNRIRYFAEKCRYMLFGCYWYARCGLAQNQVPSSLLWHEFKKYMKCMWTYVRRDFVLPQWKALLSSSFTLISDNVVESDGECNPTVFVVVRNERERMQVFLDHYRKLGVQRFVVLDNGSDDGTQELMSQQKDTKVYQITEAFGTCKKEGWIEKLLVLEGLDRWCFVVDSDELIDFVGSETHTLQEMIHTAQSRGYKRLGGAMLDMYAKDGLFSQGESFIEALRFFDKDSYTVINTDSVYPLHNITVFGGPRDRLLGGKRSISKQAVFFYDKDSIYIRCHFMYPFMCTKDVPRWYVLRHYKFLKNDKEEYLRRAREKCFYNGSVEYQIVESLDSAMSFYYEGSQEYIDSSSLRCLPFIEDIQW